MSLIKCKECGQEISTKADACPKCGAKRASQNIGCGSVLALVVLGWIVIEIFTPSTPSDTSRTTSSTSSYTPPTPAVTSEWPKILASKTPSDVKLVAEIQKMKWFDACAAWGIATRSAQASRRAEALREFLLHDGTINGLDLGNARTREVEVGMTACGTYAALGLPEAANTTTTARTTSQQLVYRSRGMYVYTEGRAGDHNGTVRTIQR